MLKNKRLAGAFVILILLGLALLLVYTYIARSRAWRLATRPIVMIQAPQNGERISNGERIITHATARSPDGISKVELWVDDQLVSTHEAEGDEPVSPFVFNTSWSSSTPGDHTLIVRAISNKGHSGQATVLVETIGEDPAAEMIAHTIQEGENLETIAVEYSISTDDLVQHNPGFSTEDPSAGGELQIPPPSDDEPPQEALIGDDFALLLLENIDFDGLPHQVPISDSPTALRFEALALSSDRAYEALHCYIGLGNRPPRWYPDMDSDQSTDESFVALASGSWDVAHQLSGHAGLFTFWPGNEPLAFEALCVGIAAGGTDAVDLGSLTLSIPSDHWDGTARKASSSGGEGQFELDYRVSLEQMQQIELQPDMPGPYDLWIDDRRTSLHWSYDSDTDESSSNPAFLIFVNDTLVWSAPHDARESRIPDQWFYPPCGTEYEFTVRAYYRPYPEGNFSPESESVTIAHGDYGSERCERRYGIEFISLQTGDLGGDGDRDPGDMGPIYGGIYANEKFVALDGRAPSSGSNVGVLDPAGGILHYQAYDFADFAWDWLDGYNIIGLDLEEGDGITFGYSIYDADTGWNNEDDWVCDGIATIDPSRVMAGEIIEGTIDGGPVDGSGVPRCRVRYVARPILGGPVGYGGSAIPLPWLELTDMTVQPGTGQLQLHIHNAGTAAWANHDLLVRVRNRRTGTENPYTWEDFYLDAGETTILQDPQLRGVRPIEVCVTLDPTDVVVEDREHTGAMYHTPDCLSLPDLIIENVEYEATSDDLHITVQNIGSGEMERYGIDLRITYADGTTAVLPYQMGEEITLDSYDTHLIVWPGSALSRPAMQDGYSLLVDPLDIVFEADEDNNEFSTRSGENLRVEWSGLNLTWYPTWRTESCTGWRTHDFLQEQTIDLSVSVRTPLSQRHLASWSTEVEFRWPGYEVVEWSPGTHAVVFEIAGEEELIIDVSGELSNDSLGSGTAVFAPQDEWSASMALSSGTCHPDIEIGIPIYPPTQRWSTCGTWSAIVQICKLQD